MAQAAPEGIDVYLDHVGGDHLEAAIGNVKVGARLALIGAISGYNATEPVPGPSARRRHPGRRRGGDRRTRPDHRLIHPVHPIDPTPHDTTPAGPPVARPAFPRSRDDQSRSPIVSAGFPRSATRAGTTVDNSANTAATTTTVA
ncbi:NADP-dependent oxidoreductase [Embleya hyalina]|uniref:NADP-dependent oxidoreductase n=1 Tax=Embleya hyalina TaxID=516124 RepID=A0A401YV09_9ACTN|nr:NADP-dependent oxidoreductase [Embleya hyalina]